MNASPIAWTGLCLLSAFAPTVEANDVGFYVGAWYGQVEKDAERVEFDALADSVYDFFGYTPTSVDSSFDNEDDGYSLFVGYRIARWLAIEGGYMALGRLSYRATTSGDFPQDSGTVNVGVDSETTGYTLAALGILPLGYNWEVYGRVGILFATNELSLSIAARGEIFATVGGDSINDAFSKSSEETYAGLGVSRRFFDIYGLRLEYQRVFSAGLEGTGGVGDIDLVTLGLTVTF